ncbi:MAG: hypothetical protein U0807_14095 [Candidatus Binatia bacterium]
MPHPLGTYEMFPRSAVGLLAELTARGFEVRLQHDQVIVCPGSEPLDDALRARIREQKAGLQQILRRFQADQPERDLTPH